jgi:uncharacterized protein
MLNLASLKTPGVYIDEVPKFPPSVAQVETAIPAFVGYTQLARQEGEDITLRPTRIVSLLEYTEFFGGPQPEKNILVTFDRQTAADGKIRKENVTAAFDTGAGGASKHLMYYALQAFFDNGGGACWIVSIGTYIADIANQVLDPALFGQGLDMLEQIDEPTLIVFPEGQAIGSADYYALQTQSIQQCQKLKDRFAVMDVHQPARMLTRAEVNTALANFRSQLSVSETEFTKYAAAYFPNIKFSFEYNYDENAVRGRIVVNGQEVEVKDFNSLNNREKAQSKGAIQGFPVCLPASAAVVGIYARVDETRGVWKAPANESVFGAQDLTYRMNDEEQETFNVDVDAGKSVNVVRFFTGKGFKVWGARTLAGNDNEWRYVSVRRFFNMVEESVKKSTYQFVFEPNDENTWIRVKGMIDNFLILQWRAGALQGATPDKAYYVKVGLGQTMTAFDILEGRLIVEIGMAVVRPAEFIVLRFMHKLPEA